MITSSSPYRVALVNMPFASLSMPSLALTQLSALLEEEFGERVAVQTHYLSFDFAAELGLEAYNHANLGEGFMSGIGEWFFRAAAFPDAEDNAEEYFGRFYFSEDEETVRIRTCFAEKRRELNDFLDRLIEQYALAENDVVGFTTLFSQTVASFAMARRLKEINPDLITVTGGAACDGVMGQEFAKQVPQVDYVFSGPALDGFPFFVGRMMAGDRAACDGINGVFSKTNRLRWPTGTALDLDVVAQGGEPPLTLLGDDQDIDRNIPLDYGPFLDDLERTFPGQEVRPVLLFETSRGCWWAEKILCSFCGLNGLQMKHRAMSCANARRHIESLFQYMPRCQTYMAVDTILPKGYIEEVFNDLRTPEGMRMFYEIKVDNVGAEEIRVLSEAGVAAFQPGIEALSTSSLKLMRKGTTAFQNLKFLMNCSKYPVSVDWNLLIFSPGESVETYEKYRRDLPLFMHLPPPTGVYPIGFVRFSRYFDEPEEFGLDLKPQDFYGLTYPFDEEAVTNVAYHFVDRGADNAGMDHWLGQLNEKVAAWGTRFLGQDGKPQARLCWLEDRSAIYDSRDGTEREIPLDEAARKVLEFIDRPMHLNQIQKAFPDVDTEAVLRRLQDEGLLFEETGRYMNLVLT